MTVEMLHAVDNVDTGVNDDDDVIAARLRPAADATISSLRSSLLDEEAPLAARYRALFSLRNLEGPKAEEVLIEALNTSASALLRHDVAFCLGQRRASTALPALALRLRDAREHPMVRHEAAEAAGAIGCRASWLLVEAHAADATREVAETCQLAVQRMTWYENREKEREKREKEEKKRIQGNGDGNGTDGKDDDDEKANEEGEEQGAGDEEEKEQPPVVRRYLSVDPAPPAEPGTPLPGLVSSLLDESGETSIFDRYRALFSLRDSGGPDAVAALCRALRKSESALLKHEVAYVLGQMQDARSLEALKECLADEAEHGMVRHEAAEALGALGAEAAVPALEKGKKDSDPVVAQSCVVALDVLEHERSGAFEYAASG